MFAPLPCWPGVPLHSGVRVGLGAVRAFATLGALVLACLWLCILARVARGCADARMRVCVLVPLTLLLRVRARV